MESNKTHDWKLLTLVAAVFIPIIAVLIPYAINYFFPSVDFSYTATGPVTIDQLTSVSLKIKNEGKEPERDVRILINSSLPQNGAPIDQLIEVATTAHYKVLMEDKQYIVDLGDLLPNDSVDISILVKNALAFSSGNNTAPYGIYVKSSNHIGSYGYSEPVNYLELFRRIVFTLVFGFLSTFGARYMFEEYWDDLHTREARLIAKLQLLRQEKE